jgi:hypothetical protein
MKISGKVAFRAGIATGPSRPIGQQPCFDSALLSPTQHIISPVRCRSPALYHATTAGLPDRRTAQLHNEVIFNRPVASASTMPVIDTAEYTTSATSFGATTSLSCLQRHVSQLEKNKLRLQDDEGLQARYLPGKASTQEPVEPLESILKPHMSELERRKERLKADESMRARYLPRETGGRKSPLKRELEDATALLNRDGRIAGAGNQEEGANNSTRDAERLDQGQDDL